MATLEHLDIPSTSAGLTWRAYIYKPQGRAAYASATEGEKTGTSFSFSLGLGVPGLGSRRAQINLPGRATLKAKKRALSDLVGALELHGFITAADATAARAAITAAEKIEG